MSNNRIYAPKYSNSWALVIGINEYQTANPLDFAGNDATAFAKALTEKFEFPAENVRVLLDAEATKEKIMSEYLRFTADDIGPDDRLIVFFAAHGMTKEGVRGEVGFLVPHDGDPSDIGSLIPWRELTTSSELIRAKHILFIMDACYGGTAIRRHLGPGSTRFARDMLSRFSRQVLTAGKADETVSDAGGPRAGHSVFTGHLLDALDGAAASPDGLITANLVMAYVYDRVAKDYQSDQTPHYGFLDGDGDVIFDLSPLPDLEESPETDEDIFIDIPAGNRQQDEEPSPPKLTDLLKTYLSEPQYRIKLDDRVSAEIRSVLERTGEEHFPIHSGNASAEDIADALGRYENAVGDLATMTIMLSHWGDSTHKGSLQKIFARLPDAITSKGGSTLWLDMRWYPVSLLMYVAGIAAVSANNYENLDLVFHTTVQGTSSGDAATPISLAATDAMLSVQGMNAFKVLPGHERHHTPRSEYMFKVVQPIVDDQLFLGRSFEGLFDRFELMLALCYAHTRPDGRSEFWGPIGRFGWKYSHRHSGNNPFDQLVAEANSHGENWEPLRAGLFGGSHERFVVVSDGFREILNEVRMF